MYDGSRPGAADPDLRDVGGGLKVRDLLEGDGAEVKEEDTVTCDYTGWLLDGTIFDSSWKGGTPATFGLNGVIRGWTKGIPGMKVGGIRKLVIPQELGYGERGSPPTIPPMATLVFEVQVLAIKDDSKEKGGRGKMPPGHP
ncbi:MAG: FKBP-type peptidyl-prolyl cis-trans isomerase [Gemmataceae bacterium]|nr:FKBP-type peptidyl-prolyl cis-trans isomerase [Gemmataceae bacterium]